MARLRLSQSKRWSSPQPTPGGAPPFSQYPTWPGGTYPAQNMTNSQSIGWRSTLPQYQNNWGAIGISHPNYPNVGTNTSIGGMSTSQAVMAQSQGQSSPFNAQLSANINSVSTAISNAGKATQKFESGQLRLAQAWTIWHFGSTVVQAISKSMNEARDATVSFEKEMTGLISIGKNADSIGAIKAIKQEVLGISAAFGISTKAAADFTYMIQSGTYGIGLTHNPNKLSDDQIGKQIGRLALQTSVTTGTDPTVAANEMIKSWKIFGGQPGLGSLQAMQAKLHQTADLGMMTDEDMAQRFPLVASVAGGQGMRGDEIMAMLAVATRRGGDPQTTFTGVRNMLARLSKAEEKGEINPAPMEFYTDESGKRQKRYKEGALFRQMSELAKVDSDLLTSIFGVRTVATAENISKSVQEMKEALKSIQDVPDNLIAQKLGVRMLDPAFRAEREQATNASIRENIGKDLSTPSGKRNARYLSDKEARYNALKEHLYTPLNFLATPIAHIQTMASDFASAISDKPLDPNSPLSKSLDVGREMSIKRKYDESGMMITGFESEDSEYRSDLYTYGEKTAQANQLRRNMAEKLGIKLPGMPGYNSKDKNMVKAAKEFQDKLPMQKIRDIAGSHGALDIGEHKPIPIKSKPISPIKTIQHKQKMSFHNPLEGTGTELASYGAGAAGMVGDALGFIASSLGGIFEHTKHLPKAVQRSNIAAHNSPQ